MNKNKIITGIIIFIITVSLSGCIGVNKGFRDMRTHILDNLEGDFHKVMEFSVGPSTLFLAGFLTKLADTEEDVHGIINQLSRVQVSIFENRTGDSFRASFKVMKSLSERMKEKGWKYIVRTVDGNEMVGVFIPALNQERLSQIFVVAITEEEMVITEVLGDLENIVEIAIRDHGLNSIMDEHI